MPIAILVVDDDKIMLDLVNHQLAHFGYNVHVARSGAEAIGWLKSHRVDMIITDYRMENMNGNQLRDRIRNEIGQIPIIVMTGERDPKLRLGFDGFLQKPFSMTELRNEVERVRIGSGRE
ncbi:MAG: response regulator [Syntrophobacteraceae bacterium]